MEPTLKMMTAAHLIPRAGEVVSPGALVIEAGKILAVGSPEELSKKYPEASREDFPASVLLPGLVNAHADLSLSIGEKDTPAMPDHEGGSLMPWLIRLSRYKAALSPSEQQKALRLGLEIQRNQGVTTVGDKCRFPIGLPLYRDSGLRVLALAEVENVQRPLAQEDFEQALAIVDEIDRDQHPRLQAGLAPFSAYTLSKNLLKLLADEALHQNRPLHLHAAMSFSEMEFFYDSMGEITAVLFREAGWEDKIPPPHRMTPIQYLHEIGFLKCHPSLIGCLHLGPTDQAILENQKCLRIYSPQAFRALHLGAIPWDQLMSEKIPFALGTLGIRWGSNLSLWEEMREALSTISEENQEAAAAGLLLAATQGGAGALGMGDQIGVLEAGRQADFILMEVPLSERAPHRSLLAAAGPESLQASFVAGQQVR